MWRKLQNMVIEFKTGTEEKRRQYNQLLSKDKIGVAEVAENNKKIACGVRIVERGKKKPPWMAAKKNQLATGCCGGCRVIS